MDNREIANEIAEVAKMLMAGRYSVEDFLRAYNSRNYDYVSMFSGKKKPGVRPTWVRKMKRKMKLNVEGVSKAIVDILTLAELDEGLVLTFVGTEGRVDTYVFTETPYAEAFANSFGEKKVTTPRRPVMEIAAEVALKLKKLGLSNLGGRYGKAGDQYGLPESARRIGLGRREFMLNYLLVQEDGYGGQESRWSYKTSYLLSELTDEMILKAVFWVKAAPTMKEVRAKARAEGTALGL